MTCFHLHKMSPMTHQLRRLYQRKRRQYLGKWILLGLIKTTVSSSEVNTLGFQDIPGKSQDIVQYYRFSIFFHVRQF